MRNKLASSIAILLNYGAKWRLLYYVFYVLCFDFELSNILDPSILYFAQDPNLPSSHSRYKATLFSETGILRQLIGYSNIARYLKN